MKDVMRDELIFCVGRLKGILSLVEFDSDEDGLVVNDRLNEVVSDMEMILKNVDESPRILTGVTLSKRGDAK